MSGLPQRFTASRIKKALALALSLCFAVCFTCAIAPGDEIQAIWAAPGGSGNWFPQQVQNTNWFCINGVSRPPCVPSGSGYVANIGANLVNEGFSGQVYLNQPVSLDGVSLGNGLPGQLVVSAPANSLTVGTLDVAVSNNGDLSIQSGGVVTAASRIDLGVLSTIAPGITVFGTATVTGAGSQLNLSNATGTLTVGDAGTGELTIKNGGVVTSNGQIIMGSQSSGRGVISVDGPGSTLNSQGAIYVRNNASLMEISGGGVVNGAGISIGPGNDADLVVTDSGSVLNNKGPLSVGSNGRGLLLIVRGGAVNNDGDAVIGAQPGSQGHAIVGGGNARWINAGSLNIGSLGSGVLDISNGRVSANTITIGTGGAVNISNGMLSANTITDHGILDNEPFTESQIDLNGSFILASDGTVGFGIKGNDNSDHTVLDISGSSLFQGTLRLDFLDGFTPKKGDTFDLINDPEGADFTGATFEVTGLGAGFKYSETFSDGMFILTALNNGINTTTTPEPGTLGLLAAALAINFGIHVKRRVAPRRQT